MRALSRYEREPRAVLDEGRRARLAAVLAPGIEQARQRPGVIILARDAILGA